MTSVRKYMAIPLAALLVACQGTGSVDYKDPSAPVEARVKDLLGKMTMEEKLRQLSQTNMVPDLVNDGEFDETKLDEVIGSDGYGSVQGIVLTGEKATEYYNRVQRYCVEKTRLGIPIFTTTESLHGSVQDGSTIFPQSIGVAATFDPELANRMTTAVAGELFSQGVNQVLCPVVDVTRDPRWGRTEETFGEDPYLNGLFGIAEVKGYLDNGLNSVLKHYGPGAETQGGLNLASVSCSPRDLLQIHLKPFEMVVRNTNLHGIMSSYDTWDRIPNSASHYLLTELLRDEWGFDGYVYSDWGAISFLHSFHNVAANEAEAGRMAITAGLDFEASSGCFWKLPELVEQGKMDESVINQAVARVLKVKFEMGLFENPYRNEGGKPQMRSEENKALARRMADESIVLLKNENNLLPLDADHLRSLAVIGPNADQVQFGDYSWSRSNEDGVTPLAGLRQLLGERVNIRYAKGCDLVTDDRSGFAEAVNAARSSDATLLFLGTASASLARDYSNVTSGEGFDQCDLNLTGVQQQLLEAVSATGKPVVLVLVTGKPISLPWAKEHVPAIVAQWYGGEAAGNAIADMLMGNTVPSGKTPISWPQSAGHLPCFYNHLPSDRGFYHQPGAPNNPGRDYVSSSPDPLWAFGHGLSYTSFEYGEPILPATQLLPTDTLTVGLDVRNTGSCDGKEVVQLYFNDVASTLATPVKQLKAFTKVEIPAGESRRVEMRVPVSEFAYYDMDMNLQVEPGEFDIMIGSSSDDIRHSTRIQVGAKGSVIKTDPVTNASFMVTPDGDTIRRE